MVASARLGLEVRDLMVVRGVGIAVEIEVRGFEGVGEVEEVQWCLG